MYFNPTRNKHRFGSRTSNTPIFGEIIRTPHPKPIKSNTHHTAVRLTHLRYSKFLWDNSYSCPWSNQIQHATYSSSAHTPQILLHILRNLPILSHILRHLPLLSPIESNLTHNTQRFRSHTDAINCFRQALSASPLAIEAVSKQRRVKETHEHEKRPIKETYEYATEIHTRDLWSCRERYECSLKLLMAVAKCTRDLRLKNIWQIRMSMRKDLWKCKRNPSTRPW